MRLSEVVDALFELRQAGSEHGATRTAVMTLVAVPFDDDQAYAASTALRALGAHHPARIIIMRPSPEGVANLDARAELFRTGDEESGVCFEEVTLTVGGQAAKHLDSFVEALTLADLPVAVWFPGTVPDPSDQLLSIASAVIVDTRETGSIEELRLLLELARRRTLIDLSWIRLEPWRQLLAGLFDPPSYRDYVTEISEVMVAGKEGPRRIISGWLLSQLRLNKEQMRLCDARHVGIHVECQGEVGSATFEVSRAENQRSLWALATASSEPPLRQLFPLPEDSLVGSLSQALTHLEPDVIWERALSAACNLADLA